MLTVLVERVFGSILPLKVKLSPPNKFNVVLGYTLVKTHVMVSAVTASSTAMIPVRLVKIGK